MAALATRGPSDARAVRPPCRRVAAAALLGLALLGGQVLPSSCTTMATPADKEEPAPAEAGACAEAPGSATGAPPLPDSCAGGGAGSPESSGPGPSPSLLQVASSRDSPVRVPTSAPAVSDEVEDAIKEALGVDEPTSEEPAEAGTRRAEAADEEEAPGGAGGGGGPGEGPAEAGRHRAEAADEVEVVGSVKGKTGKEACEKHDIHMEACAEIGCCRWSPETGRCWSAVKNGLCHATVHKQVVGSVKGKTGKEACEMQGFDRETCAEIGCCEWGAKTGQCWSAVKDGLCRDTDQKRASAGDDNKHKPTANKHKETAPSSHRVATKVHDNERTKADDNEHVVIVREREADDATVRDTDTIDEAGQVVDWSDNSVDIADTGCDGRTGTDCVRVDAPVSANPGRLAPRGSCQPLCKWECESSPCEGNCRPECEQPKCETRCSAVTTKGCVMECDQPQCCTVCPKTACAGAGSCPLCTTNCSKPMCRLRCPQTQDCKAICEEPKCKWRCKEPSACPVPKCRLACEEPSCLVGGSHRPIPALKQGELKVSSFVAPAGLLQLGEASTRAALYQVAAVETPEHKDGFEPTSPTVPVLVETMSEDSQPQKRTIAIPVLVRDRQKHTSQQ